MLICADSVNKDHSREAFEEWYGQANLVILISSSKKTHILDGFPHGTPSASDLADALGAALTRLALTIDAEGDYASTRRTNQVSGDEMSDKYRPSNGTEGDWFMSHFCYQCAAYNICKIWPATMALGVNDPKYPKQWIETEEGAECTSFVSTDSIKRKPYHCDKTLEMFS